jgi:hypothetical protein
MNGEWRVMGRGVAWPLLSGAVAGVLAGMVAGCTGGSSVANPIDPTGPAGPGAVTGTAVTTAAVPRSVAYDLYTHCGIYEAKVAGRWYLASPPLTDGNGNPPAGWGNPYQRGTMLLVSPAEVVFTDRADHKVVFHAAPASGKYPDHVCS